MSHHNGQHTELADLLEALCEERLDQQQAARLEQLVLSDPDARRFYLNYVDLHGSLHWDTAVGIDGSPRADASAQLRGAADESVVPALIVRASTVRDEAEPHPTQALLRPACEVLGSTKPSARRFGATALVVATCVALVAHGIVKYRDAGSSRPHENVAGDDRDLPPPHVDLPASNEIAQKTPSTTGSPSSPEPPVIVSPIERPRDSDGRDRNQVGVAKPVDTDIPAARGKLPSDKPTGVASQPASLDAIVTFVDSRVQDGWTANEVEPSPIAEDAEWLRRVYLDIAGHIPPVDAVESFLESKSPRKRSVVIDTLLDDQAYARNWSTIWTNRLIGRSNTRAVDRWALRKYLRESLAYNRPWDEMVAEFVSAEGNSSENGATNFLLAHLNNQAVPATAIVSQVFLGVQAQCTQCHDHPVNNAKQNEFWELNSFFQQTEIVRSEKRDASTGVAASRFELATERVGGPVYYETLRGVVKVAFPSFAGTRVEPSEQVNLRRELAKLMAQGEKPRIAEALVNRLWAHFFGFGFTRPVDDMGPHNPPTHPEVLDRLAREFVGSGYDVKQLIRWICHTDAYQRTSRFGPANAADDPARGTDPLFSRVYVKPMTAEQLYDSLLIATAAHLAAGSDWTEVERQRHDWLQQFVYAFDTEENDEVSTFDGTIPQALMMMNSDLIRRAVSGAHGTFLERLTRTPGNDADKFKQLCLSTLSRYPTALEIAAFRQHVRDRSSPQPRSSTPPLAVSTGLQDVLWAYLNANEFVLIH